MKILPLIAVAILGVCSTVTAHKLQDDFTLQIDVDTITVSAGETATFNLSITVPKDFDASVLLTVSPQGYSSVTAMDVRLSSVAVNAPFTGAHVTVKTTANDTKQGIYPILVSLTNTQPATVARCYVNVRVPPPSPWSKTWRIYSQDYGAPDFLQQDDHNSYWYHAAAFDYGIRRLSGSFSAERWNATQPPSGFPVTFIPPIIYAAKNRIWIPSYQSGIVRTSLDGKNVTYFTTQNSPVPDYRITAIAIDTFTNSNGIIWAGTKNGLVRISGTDVTAFDSTNSVLRNERITCISVYDTTVWVGTTMGLVKFDGKTWTRFTAENSDLEHEYIRTIAVDKKGVVWMGVCKKDAYFNDQGEAFGRMEGLASYDGKQWKLYTNANSPLHSTNYVNGIAIDKYNNKWLATSSHYMTNSAFPYVGGAGLLKFNDTTWTAYTSKNSPLISLWIYWVYADNDGHVWFSSDAAWGVMNELGLPYFITSVKEHPVSIENTISITPNPSRTSFIIKGVEAATSIQVINSLGIEVLRQNVFSADEIVLDMTDQPSGVYYAQVHLPTGISSKMLVLIR
ncbi:MAG: T9SS type A sorting domain-containing protein [Ignavibacteria bacterium]|nr:T9SS type A sorting domain-containing protein [Ignavibacteria bacterium]